MTAEIAFTIEEPVPFTGTPDEARQNFATHSFTNDDDPACLRCDVRVWMASASYPCGVEIPRQQRTVYSDGTQITEKGNK